MGKKRIPDEVRAQVDAIVERFNKKELRSQRSFYVARFRGSYLYLDRNDWGASATSAASNTTARWMTGILPFSSTATSDTTRMSG